jgi:hypothetical protein
MPARNQKNKERAETILNPAIVAELREYLACNPGDARDRATSQAA